MRLNVFDKNPWTKYKRFMKVNRAGPATLAYDTDRPEKIFAVKEVKGFGKDSLSRLHPTIHSNIVRFVVAYYNEESCFFFYDDINIHLIDLLSSPKGNLEIDDIATICRGLTEALAYLHNDLGICYGTITTQNVLLSKVGEVKLGNISLKEPIQVEKIN